MKTFKYLLIISIFILLANNIYITAQTKNIDSALTALKNYKQEDTGKVLLMKDICKGLGKQKPDEGLKYGKEALELSQRLNYTRGIAEVLNSIGTVYYYKANYDSALNYYLKAETKYKETTDKLGLAKSLNNIGLIYDIKGDYSKSLGYYLQSLKILESLDDKKLLGTTYNNIGLVYMKQTNLPDYLDKSLDFFKKSLKIREDLGDKAAIASSYYNLGLVYLQKGNKLKRLDEKNKNIYLLYDTALMYSNKSLNIYNEIKDIRGLATVYPNIANIYGSKKDYKKSEEFYVNAIKLQQQTGDIANLAYSLFNVGVLNTEQKNYDKAIEYYKKSLIYADSLNIKTLRRDCYDRMASTYSFANRYKEAFECMLKYSELKDEILNEESSKMITEMQTKYETDKKAKEIEILNLAMSKQKIWNYALIGGIILVLIIALISINSYIQKRKDNKIIAAEKAKSDALLLNTLPLKVVNDLKTYGKTEPESFDNVTVYFSDVVGFTTISSTLEPKTLINALSEMFTNFDSIMTRWQCERIKTIGDAYLAVSGMPEKNERHAYNMLRAAIDIREYLIKRNETAEIKFRCRIGINTGRVVGGIVGTKKYLYDVFGDTINTASRMESNSEPLKINISESTYELVKDMFILTDRGIMEVKGKGPMRMFFVEDVKEEYRNI